MNYTYYNDNDHFCCEVLRKNIRQGNLPGGYVDERDIRDVRATDLAGYRHIHLFAGIGGFPLGLSRAGVSPDLRIITGGFPCQDISNAGKRAGISGERSGLWSEMYRLICELRPRYILVENVAALTSRGIDTVLGDLAASGYDAEWTIISAESVGAPHLRERLFLVAYSTSNGCAQRRDRSRFTPLSKIPINASHNGSQDVADPDRQRLAVGQVFGGDALAQLTAFKRDCGTGSGVWAVESSVGRVAPRIPRRVDRLKSLGNAIVPQCAEYIGRCIVAREQQMEEDNDVA